MASLLHTYALLALAMLGYMSVWFGIAILKKRNDVADVAWGLGFAFVAIISFFKNGAVFDRGLVVTALVLIWALRLSIHIYLRNKGKGEDYRYKAWREAWGKWFYVRTYLQVFMLQGFLLLLVVSPVIITQVYHKGGFGLLDVAGILVWLTGFLFETIGDRQLATFLKNPLNKGKLMQSGLWLYSRHPNYFGEVAQWWGLWLFALATPYGWLGIIGPLTITLLILKVSGVPMLEAKMVTHPDFASYRQRVSKFIPLPPRRLSETTR